MGNLALKGHAKRGREVIQLLEMLGGNNIHNYGGTFNECYAIDNNKICTIYTSVAKIDNCVIFTLEEFEEKFPYKVGDIVKCHNIWKGIIESMEWYEGEVLYHVRDYPNNYLASETVEHLQPYKEENMEERKSIDLNKLEQQLDEALAKETPESLNKWLDEENMKTNNLCTRCVYAVDNHCGLRGFTNDFNRLYCSAQNADKLPNGFELQPDGYFSWVDSKPQYPKTYMECCEVLRLPSQNILVYDNSECGNHDYFLNLLTSLNQFTSLKICRDAYWKVYGEQIGLGNPWSPNWCNENKLKYCIECSFGTIDKTVSIVNGCFLAFPTAEMRDIFFENFKDLIEQCKELL